MLTSSGGDESGDGTGGDPLQDEHRGLLPPELADGVIQTPLVPLLWRFEGGEWISGWDVGTSASTPATATTGVAAVYLLCADSGYADCPGAGMRGKPIFDTVPSSEGYSPFWQVHKVRVPDDYSPNTIKSEATIFRSGWDIEPMPMVVNCPIHSPESRLEGNEGDDTAFVADGGAWWDGYAVYYWDFAATLGPLPLGAGGVDAVDLWQVQPVGSESVANEVEAGMDLNGDGDRSDTNDVIAARADGPTEQVLAVHLAVLEEDLALATDDPDPTTSVLQGLEDMSAAEAAGSLSLQRAAAPEIRNFARRVPRATGMRRAAFGFTSPRRRPSAR